MNNNTVAGCVLMLTCGLIAAGLGACGGSYCERLTWQSEIVSRGYGEWVPSKEDPTRNVFAWKENKKENKEK